MVRREEVVRARLVRAHRPGAPACGTAAGSPRGRRDRSSSRTATFAPIALSGGAASARRTVARTSSRAASAATTARPTTPEAPATITVMRSRLPMPPLVSSRWSRGADCRADRAGARRASRWRSGPRRGTPRRRTAAGWCGPRAGRAFVKIAAYDYTADVAAPRAPELRRAAGTRVHAAVPRVGRRRPSRPRSRSRTSPGRPGRRRGARAAIARRAARRSRSCAPRRRPAASDRRRRGRDVRPRRGVAADRWPIPAGSSPSACARRAGSPSTRMRCVAAADRAQVDGDDAHPRRRPQRQPLHPRRARGLRGLELALSRPRGPGPGRVAPVARPRAARARGRCSPAAAAHAALLAGFFLEHARREPIPQAPHVRADAARPGPGGVGLGRPRAGPAAAPALTRLCCTCNTLLHSPRDAHRAWSSTPT